MPRIGPTPRRRSPVSRESVQSCPIPWSLHGIGRHRELAGRVDDFLARLPLGLPDDPMVERIIILPLTPHWLVRLPGSICDEYFLRP